MRLRRCAVSSYKWPAQSTPGTRSGPAVSSKSTPSYDDCWRTALSTVCDEGATISHHHGVGFSKQSFLPREHGEGMRQLRALKAAFDPHGILNPGKLLL